jgi:sugar lactone lactonase YvrE
MPKMTIVLLPGETLVPGVGITGTPVPQAKAVPFSINVYAVDDFFNIAPGASDTIYVSTSDPGDIEPPPSPLVQGHAVFQIAPATLGTWVVSISGGPGPNRDSSLYAVVPRITTVAGNGSSGFSGDGGPATNARMTNPVGVLFDSAGNIFFADSGSSRVREVNLSGIISTLVQDMSAVTGMAFDGGGNLYIVAEIEHAVYQMPPGGSANKIVGTGIRTGSIDGQGGDPRDDLGDGRQALSCSLNFPTGVALDANGNLYIADKNNYRVRKVDHVTGIISTIAGTGVAGSSGDGGPATSAQLNQPSGLALDSQGDLYIAEEGGNRVRKVSPSGIISTVAGTGSYGYSGDNGPATSAKLAIPFGIAVDGAGNLYIADTGNDRIRKVDGAGTITTIAGNGSAGFAGDGGASTAASLNKPLGVAVDSAGNIVIADTYNQRIRRLQVAN